MAKEESGRLLSKVAKFVRNPLKDWSELDRPDAPVEAGYSREALKEMIERRQRNDFVRRREFDMLRKLRQREAEGAREGSGTPSSFQFNSSGKTDGRALTLKKIDEIEEQMSQQWWKGKAQASDGAEPLAAEHARAYADTAPGTPPTLVTESGALSAGDARLPQLVAETALDEAAVRFAQGDDAGAEALLQQAVGNDDADDEDTWRALLDLYRATGDAEKFGAAGTRYVQRFKRAAPEWVSLRALAHAALAGGRQSTEQGIDWYCPEELGREALGELTQALSAAGPVWRIDWRALRRIDPMALAPLAALFSHWGNAPVQLRFGGAERLVRLLAEATPVTERGTDLAWWQLYMAVLRAMHLADDFELVALNYCITYEVSPPTWEDPQGQYASLDSASGANGRPDGLQILSDEPAEDDEAPARATLGGELVRASPVTWQRLDAELADIDPPIVSCGALVRMDLAATADLLQWVRAREAKGQRVELAELHRLLLAFLCLAGVDEHALLSPRP